MTTYLHRLIDYNNWANRGLLEFLRTLPEEALDLRAGGVFGSIRQTFEHLLSSEFRYHRSLLSLPQVDAVRSETPSLDDLAVLARESGANLNRLVDSLPEPGTMMQLRDGSRSAATILTQLLVHGVEHRAHIGTILGANGISGPELDGWAHGIFAYGDAWPADWGSEPQERAPFPTPDQD